MIHKPVTRYFPVVALLAVFSLLQSCGGSANSGAGKGKDSVKVASICVDETYMPVIRQVAELFHHHYADRDVIATYKPEREAILDLLRDSIKVAIVSRPATQNEKAKLEYDGKIKIHEVLVGYDAMTLIVNKSNPVKKISVENMRRMVSGQIKNWKELGGDDLEIVMVFDNPSSGTVRYMKDSLLKGGDLPSNVYSAKTNPEVIRYVGETAQAVGFIGLAWVSDKDSPEVQEYLAKVDKMALKAEGLPDLPENYYLPFASEIALGQYPLSRHIYCLNRESSHGTGTDFVYFFGSDVGQRVLLKAGLLPANMPPRAVGFREEK